MPDIFTAEDVQRFEADQRARAEAAAAARSAEAERLRRSYDPYQKPRIYSRAEVAALYEQRRRGEWRGTELEWARQEVELIRAGAQGRISGALDPAGHKEQLMEG